MRELVCRSSDYCTLSVRSLKNYTPPSRKERTGYFDGKGYNPSKEFSRKKKEIVKQEEKLRERMKNDNYLVARKRIEINTNKLGESIELFILNK